MTVGVNQIDFYPWRERYYDDDLASGANDGTTPADAWQSLTDMAAGVGPGDRVNMKKTASPVTLTASFTFPAGDNGGMIYYRGYGVDPGDQIKWIGEPTTTFLFNAATGPQLFSDITFAGNAVTTTASIVATGDQQTTFFRCAMSNDSSAPAMNMGENVLIACVLTNSDATGGTLNEALTGNGVVIGCKLESEDGAVIDMTIFDESEHILLFKNTFISNSAEVRDCAQIGQQFAEISYVAILENSFYGGLHGINFDLQIATVEAATLVANNVISGCDTGIDMTDAGDRELSACVNNAIGNNTTADYGTGFGNFEDLFHKIPLTANPYASFTDLSLNDVAGGGTVCRDGGIVGLLAGATGETFDPASDLGGNRHGVDDGGDPDTLVPESQAPSGAGIKPWYAGILPFTRTSELST